MESVFASATDVHSEHQRDNSQVRNKGWILCKSIGSIHHQTLVNIVLVLDINKCIGNIPKSIWNQASLIGWLDRSTNQRSLSSWFPMELCFQNRFTWSGYRHMIGWPARLTNHGPSFQLTFTWSSPNFFHNWDKWKIQEKPWFKSSQFAWTLQ